MSKASIPTVEDAQKAQCTVKLREHPSLTTGTAVITVLTGDNPKRPNSASYVRYFAYGKVVDGKPVINRGDTLTVADFLKAGGTRRDISWDYEHGYITLTAAPKPNPSA